MSPGHLYKSLRPEGKNKPGGRVGGALCGSKLEKPESCVDPFTSLPLACSNTSGFCEEGTHVEKAFGTWHITFGGSSAECSGRAAASTTS